MLILFIKWVTSVLLSWSRWRHFFTGWVITRMSDWTNGSALCFPLRNTQSYSLFQMSLGLWKVWKLLVNSTPLSQEKWLRLMLPLQIIQDLSINPVIKMVRCHFYLSIMNTVWILATTNGSAIPVLQFNGVET